MRPYRFRNTPKEKEYEYYVEDSTKELNRAKIFYNEIDNQHLGIKSKFNHFKKCVDEEMQNRDLLIPATKLFYEKCFKKNPNYGQSSFVEDAFNLVTLGVFSDGTEEKKYILNDSINVETYFNKAKGLSNKDKLLKEEIRSVQYDFTDIFYRGGYKNFYNRAEKNYVKPLPVFSSATIDLVEEYWHPGSYRDFDRDLWMYHEDTDQYDCSPLGRHILDGYQLNLKPYLKKLNQVDIDKTEEEYKEFLKEQKKIFYATVIVPLMGWKKGSSEKLVQELRIKKHETTNGYIYILTNKAFPNYIKIGSTMKDPRIRAHELTGTGVPFPYEVKFKIMTKNCEILEKKVHTILEKKRVDLEREFFECSVEEAKKIIEKVVEIGK
jgi:hypothetical protein